MRLKVIAGNLAVVLLLGLFAYVFVGGRLRTQLLANIDGRIASDRQLFDRSLRLSALEFQALVEERARCATCSAASIRTAAEPVPSRLPSRPRRGSQIRRAAPGVPRTSP